MTLEELHKLLDPRVQQLVTLHAGDDPRLFAMRFHEQRELPVRAMAEQIACRRKALKKLPSLSRFEFLYTSLALEQCTSERIARYRASVMKGTRLIDMSGGLGIDTMMLAGSFRDVVSCERDEVLCAIAEHNMKKAGISNVELRLGDSIELLASFPDSHFDWIYVDPARREEGRRSVGLRAASPDVTLCHDMMLRKSPKVCIKASPALEVKGLEALLPSLSLVIAVSLEGECKEILLLLDRDHPQAFRSPVKAVCLGSELPDIIEIKGDVDTAKVVAGSVGRCLFEPDPAVIKLGLAAVVAGNYGLEFVNGSVDYLTSDFQVEPFPGRSFEVVDTVPFKPRDFSAFLEKHHLDLKGASVQRRDFPLSPDEIRKKYRLKENDRHFLIFTRDRRGSLLCIYGIRLFREGGEVHAGQGRNEDPEC
ncbi:MAG: hypothetical protein HGA70_06025 [Chlorobiaceae bacterium]|nr:hypothetical protein [Chlorobiaceae bacterium]